MATTLHVIAFDGEGSQTYQWDGHASEMAQAVEVMERVMKELPNAVAAIILQQTIMILERGVGGAFTVTPSVRLVAAKTKDQPDDPEPVEQPDNQPPQQSAEDKLVAALKEYITEESFGVPTEEELASSADSIMRLIGAWHSGATININYKF